MATDSAHRQIIRSDIPFDLSICVNRCNLWLPDLQSVQSVASDYERAFCQWKQIAGIVKSSVQTSRSDLSICVNRCNLWLPDLQSAQSVASDYERAFCQWKQIAGIVKLSVQTSRSDLSICVNRCNLWLPDLQSVQSVAIREAARLRTLCVQREIIGTVVGAKLQSPNHYLIEIECDGLEDATAFEILAIGLPFESIVLESAAGSRITLNCSDGPNIAHGMPVKVTIKVPERIDAEP